MRRYIRHALILEQRRMGMYTALEAVPVPQKKSPAAVSEHHHTQTVSLSRSLIQPIQEGVIDLRSMTGKKPVMQPPYLLEQTHTPRQFFSKYKLFALFLLLVLIGGVCTWFYFSKVLVKSRNFQITDVQIHEELLPASQEGK